MYLCSFLRANVYEGISPAEGGDAFVHNRERKK
jgi:hypothetical protein